MHAKGEIAFTLTAKSTTEVTSEMPITPGMLNPFGVVNAGAIIWFADVTASVLLLEGVNPQAGMQGFPLAININANLVNNRKEGKFLAKAVYVKKGKTVSVVHTQVTDNEYKVIADITSNHVLTV